MQDTYHNTSVHCEGVIYCANRIPDWDLWILCDRNPALNSQGLFPSHTTGTQASPSLAALELGFWQARGVLLPHRLWFLRSERSRGSPQGTQGCSLQQPPAHPPHQPPTLGLRVPSSTQPGSDTDSSSWAVTAPPVRAADNTPSHGRGYQQCAATFSRVNMGKMQGLQSCWKTCLSGVVQLTKTKC